MSQTGNSSWFSRDGHQLIEEQVERTPEAPALVMGPATISFRELNSRSNRLAHFLHAKGATAESLVGVCLDRSIHSIVSLIAILKSGAVYLPLDPKFPKERLAFMLEDSEVGLILTDSSQRETLPPCKAQIVALDEETSVLSKFPETNLAPVAHLEQPAYVIYTSGSTGKPKGVMVPRRALVNFLLSMKETPGMSSSDIHLAVTTASFDISILEFLLPLIAGARIVIATAEQAADGRELQRLLREHAITVMQATPTSWRMLLESGWDGQNDLRILCGGEALSSELAAKLLPRCRELWNMYGPTETTIWSSTQRVTAAESITLGQPIANTTFHVLDPDRNPVSQGMSGELWIGGEGLAIGYLKRPELTAEKFAVVSTGSSSEARLYRTGDEVRSRGDGMLEFIGRLDQQVKLNGFRIELGEIENALAGIEGITQAVVVLREDRPGEKRLVAYYGGRGDLSSSSLVGALRNTLPPYMIPSAFVHLEKFPLTPNAKLDRKALPAPAGKRPLLAQAFIAPRTPTEKQLAECWCDLLQLELVGIDDSFFDLGGNSLAAIRMVSRYHERFGREIPPVKVFQFPTIAQLAEFLDGIESNVDLLSEAARRARRRQNGAAPGREKIAIVAMSGRFPGADNLDKLWHNLCNGVESITFFSREELGPGIDENLRNDPDYIPARGLIAGADLFDAAFFGISPLEAQVMDPQQRVFLELANEVLESAGYDPERYKGKIGVFAGIGDNHYYTTNLLTRPDLLARAGKLAVEYGNQKDYIALRTAYLLDLRGPAVSLNTACSTTLLAVDQACRSLLDCECDLALSGGIDITVPQKSGFFYQEGGTFAKDGHCRPFDADATGTMFCDGAGVVVLKRLSEAQRDGDTIYAVICGTGKNNNGARPASFLAPSVDGQADAIAMAQADANIPIESIGYIEAHGTGTPVGDPIEFEALRKVFQSKTDKKQFCYIGSIKGNVGHPTNAAGIAGLIKAALALHREQIPPTLHFKKPNPKIEFGNSPFRIADKLIPFPRNEEVRRTAVSSFGFGGTNVHAILEEAPPIRAANISRPLQLLQFSARTSAALDAYGGALAQYLNTAPPGVLPDAAFTLQTGRKQMAYRRFVVAADCGEAATLLRQPNPLRGSSKLCQRRNPPVVFVFGGQGTQYVNMGLNLYRDEPVVRAVIDDCCEYLKPHLDLDLRELLYPPSTDTKAAQISLENTFLTQPSIFVIEYALARFWQSLGIEPATMVGHSIGEFVAATLAGVWTLEDALGIVALRGRLMQNIPRGCMLAVNNGADAVANMLPETLQLASNNAPSLCVVSGPEADIVEFEKRLQRDNVISRRLHTSHAFHSAMMDPILAPLHAAIAKVPLHAPERPFISTVTGRPISARECTDPGYWARHARSTVQFSKAIGYLQEREYDLFLECGPRATSCSLVRQHFTPDRPCTAIPSLSDTHENNAEWVALLFALGSLWQNGVSIDWDAFYAHEDRRRIPLPTYPFERQRFWVDPAAMASNAPLVSAPAFGRVSQATSPERAVTAPPVSCRKDRIAERLLELLAPLSGRERSQLSLSATFMEQGLDSLSLTQFAFAIRKELSAKISFTQLMHDWPNIEMLAENLDRVLPADVLSQEVETPASTPSASILTAEVTSEPKNDSLVEVVAEQSRTIARLVALLENRTATGTVAADRSANVLNTLRTASEEIETTIAQRGIYASSCLSDRLSAAYNESMTIRFTGQISSERLTRAVQRLADRHDALRARFDRTGHVMKIAPAQQVAVPVTDLSGLSDSAAQEQQLNHLIASDSEQPFPLPQGPLFRCQIVLLGQDRAALIFTAHHVICDGWSLDVLLHDLCAFYAEEISGVPASLDPAESYLEYVKTVVGRSGSEEFKQAGEYWRSKFAHGFPALRLPADRERAARREFEARRLDHRIPVDASQKVRAFAAQQGCSFFSALLGGLAILLARISRQRRFVIALPTAEQPTLGRPGLAGHCVNLLPFAVEIRDGESVRHFIERVQRDLLEAQEHAIFTLISLLENAGVVAPSPGISPVSAGLTNVKEFTLDQLPHSGFTVSYDANPKSYESFELYFNAVEREDAVELRCHYSTKLFEEVTVREWLISLEQILQTMSAEPSKTILELTGIRDLESAPAAPEPFTSRSISEPEIRFGTSASAARSTLSGDGELIQALAALCARVLHLRAVQPDDDFFTLGGHSVSAAQLSILIERELGRVAPLALLYEASTPRALAAALTRGDTPNQVQQSLAGSRCECRPPAGDVRPSPFGSVQSETQPSAGTAAVAVCDPPVEGIPALRPSSGAAVAVRKHAGVRALVEDDLEQVADLWWKFLRRHTGSAPNLVRSYLQELYFGSHSWSRNAPPSLVYESEHGRIAGFMGVVRRDMTFRGRSLCVTYGGNFVVDPAARATPAGLELLKAYIAGSQDLSLADSANENSRLLIEQLGFQTLVPFSVHWARPLQLTRYALHAAMSVTARRVATTLKNASKPLCVLLDGIFNQLRLNPFLPAKPLLQGSELDVETLLLCLSEFRGDEALYPEYTLDTLAGLLSFMQRMHPRQSLRKMLLRDERGAMVGWYLYYLQAGAVAQVVQIGGKREFTKDVLDHLFNDALQHGAIAVHGVMRSDFMPEFSEKKCFFTCHNGWTLAYSRNPDLLDALHRGDASLSRLDGEWCLNFDE